MTRLSIIIITFNEAHNIAKCIASAGLAHEVIVLDSGSTDGTPEIARSLGAIVSASDGWPGFGPQKNRALALASCDWVLSLDADERLTPELSDKIRAAIGEAGFDAYTVNRRSNFCGRYMQHSGWFPDPSLRLFRRGSARFSDDLVHERVIAQCAVGRIDGELLHESMPNLESVLDKLNRYSSAGAQSLLNKGVRGSPMKAVAHGLWAFLRTYFLRLGFLDGRWGFMLAVSNAEGTYYRYLKLWLMQQPGAAGPPQP